jgi:hypothetical protein
METLEHKDAIACDIQDHPAGEDMKREELPVAEKISTKDFRDMIMGSKSKGNLMWSLRMFDRHGVRRGLSMVTQEYPEILEKLKKYELPVDGWEHLS